jgi:hypothetical protein
MPWASLLKAIKHNMGSKLKLHWYLFFLHEGPWLCDEKKVCEKVEIYDFKWSAFREPTRFFIFLLLS